MTVTVQRYFLAGPTNLQILQGIDSGVSVSTAQASPPSFIDVTLDDAGLTSNIKQQLDDIMRYYGYEWYETAPQVAAAQAISQVVSSVLSSNQTIAVASGWVTIMTCTFKSEGVNSIARITSSVSGDVSVAGGAKMRVMFDGSAIAGASFPVLSGAPLHISTVVPVPNTAGTWTTHTVQVQVQAVGVLATLVINAASNPSGNHGTLVVEEDQGTVL